MKFQTICEIANDSFNDEKTGEVISYESFYVYLGQERIRVKVPKEQRVLFKQYVKILELENKNKPE